MKKFRKHLFFQLLITASILTLVSGCVKKESNNNSPSNELLPVITTTPVTNISYNSITSGGNITSDAGSTVIARGVCWSIAANPTIANNKTSDGTGAGSFTSAVTGLNADTSYYIRAYATNSSGTGYGSTYSFKTLSQVPGLTTTLVSNITSTSASSGGNINYDGGLAITSRGVCWSFGATPTIADSKTIDGAGAGNFTSTITGLSIDTTYHIRAYATNSAGTGYGNALSFKTVPAIGEMYEGGKVAYIFQPGDPGYDAVHSHGLIAAPTDQSTGIPWIPGSITINIPTEMALGTGNSNTNTIVGALGPGAYAAKICYDLVLGGYSDWYLPSYDELYKLYLNKDLIGGFNEGQNASFFYWSSYMYDYDVYSLGFYNGIWYRPPQVYNQYVRAIRSF